jgi:putative DNA primase/helicase
MMAATDDTSADETVQPEVAANGLPTGFYNLSDVMLYKPGDISPISPVFSPLQPHTPLHIQNPARDIIDCGMNRYFKGLNKYYKDGRSNSLTPEHLIILTRPLFDALLSVASLLDSFYEGSHPLGRSYPAAMEARYKFEGFILHRPQSVHAGDLHLIETAAIRDLWYMESVYLERLTISQSPDAEKARMKAGGKDNQTDGKQDGWVGSKLFSKPEALSLDVVILSDIKPELLVWLWPNVVPMRCVTIFAGDPGVGKSLMGLDMAARGSVGANFLNGARCEQPFETRLLMLEDDKSTIIVPRLMAMGADLTKVACVDGMSRKNVEEGEDDGQRLIVLQQDMAELSRHLLLHPAVKLVIIDPISNYMKGDNDMYNEAFRKVLSPLNKLAQDHDVAVVVVMHNSKAKDRKPLGKVGGNLGGMGVARMAWTFMMQDSGNHAMLQMKMNLGRFDGIIFTTKGVPVEIDGVITDQASMVFVQPSKVDADIAMGEAEDYEGRRDSKGEAFLRKLLPRPDSVMESGALYAAADAVGISKRTMERVVANLLVGSGRKNQGQRFYGWQDKQKIEAVGAAETIEEDLTFESPFS